MGDFSFTKKKNMDDFERFVTNHVHKYGKHSNKTPTNARLNQ